MTEPFIPPKTADRLAAPAQEGTRHKEAMAIAVSLIGNSLSPAAVFQTLKDKFGLPDKETADIVAWATAKAPAPSGFGPRQSFQPSSAQRQPKAVVAPVDPVEHCRWWLAGNEIEPGVFALSSPEPIPDNPVEQACRVFELLYAPNENINIICKFIVRDDGKQSPCGGGKTLPAADWAACFKGKGVPSLEAGAWMRPNPVEKAGGGAAGAYRDADVTCHRFVLVESDTLPLPMQLAFFASVRLPIAAVLLSGGKSAHAWVRLDAVNETDYTAQAVRLLELLEPFGFDRSNTNSSRLSRLPGAVRKLNAAGDGLQRLLFLNPKAAMQEGQLDELEESLKVQAVPEQPMRRPYMEATERYEELVANRGRLGVPTGISEFDHDTGGLKPGQMTVIAAETNCGKSTVALNIANAALKSGHGVALFTMEMDRDEIVDLLVSMNCDVDRNCFNTGNFRDGEIGRIAARANQLSMMPLWIFDDPTMNIARLRQHLAQLKGRVSLVIVDYIQILTPDDPREPREQQVAGFARGLRVIAKQMKLPFVALSQLNDEGKLRESRVAGHEAHTVIMLKLDGPDIVLRVVKGRSIRKKDYRVNYRPEYCRITSLQPQPYHDHHSH